MQVRFVVHLVHPDDAFADEMRELCESRHLDCHRHDGARAFLEGFDVCASPQCIVAESCLPGLISGAELLRLVQEQGAATPVIFYTGSADVSLAVELMKRGAFDVILPRFPHGELLERVLQALQHDRDLAQDAHEQAEKERRWALLSAREREVAALVVDGYSSKQIASTLHLSKKTVDAHRLSLMRKLGVRTPVELVRLRVG